MKRIVVCLLLLAMAHTSFSQTEPPAQLTKADYLKKSKSQKITGFVFLGIGATLLAIASAGDVDFDTAGALVVGGGLCVLASIPLFIAAGKNKRRANKASALIEMNRMPLVRSGFVASVPYPAIGIRLNFH